jgi:hypothetical protein
MDKYTAVFFGAFFILLVASIANESRTHVYTPEQYTPTKVASAGGCDVYRFVDQNKYVYFTVCPGGVK